MPEPKLTLDELFALTGQAVTAVSAISGIINEARVARADGKITPEEVRHIEEKAQAAVDALQTLVASVVKEATD